MGIIIISILKYVWMTQGASNDKINHISYIIVVRDPVIIKGLFLTFTE